MAVTVDRRCGIAASRAGSGDGSGTPPAGARGQEKSRCLSRRSFDVVLGGGIFRSRDGLLMHRVRGGIEAIAPNASLTRLEAPPLVGAALLALNSIKVGATSKQRLRRELTEERLRRSVR